MNNFLQSAIYPTLAEAVIDQMGGFESFCEDAQSIAEHGADSGFHGFIYYSDTIGFYDKNKKRILRALQDECMDIGQTMADCIASFNCIDCTSIQVESFLLGLNDEDETDLKNALSWWALERVAHDYISFIEG